MLIIKNGRIHVGNGEVLEDYDVLIRGGIIEKIGKNLDYEHIETINAVGKEVFPGFIDPLSSYGCMDITFNLKDHDETSNPITPWADIKYAFNHSEILLEELYKVGITTIGATPGNKNIIGGQMAVYKTWGRNSLQMLVKAPVGLKGSVLSNVSETYGKRNVFPMTKMGIFTKLENFLLQEKMKTESNKHSSMNENSIVHSVLKKKTPLFLSANSVSEIQSILSISKKFDIKTVICGCYQGDRCIEDIINSEASVIIGEQTYLTAKNYNRTDLKKLADIQYEGCPVSFTLSSDYGPEGKVKYLWNAIEFYKAGVKSGDVLKMMTIYPAKILGIDKTLGTIETQKKADLVIYSNNPIENYNAKALYTIVGGKIAFERGKEVK